MDQPGSNHAIATRRYTAPMTRRWQLCTFNNTIRMSPSLTCISAANTRCSHDLLSPPRPGAQIITLANVPSSELHGCISPYCLRRTQKEMCTSQSQQAVHSDMAIRRYGDTAIHDCTTKMICPCDAGGNVHTNTPSRALVVASFSWNKGNKSSRKAIKAFMHFNSLFLSVSQGQKAWCATTAGDPNRREAPITPRPPLTLWGRLYQVTLHTAWLQPSGIPPPGYHACRHGFRHGFRHTTATTHAGMASGMASGMATGCLPLIHAPIVVNQVIQVIVRNASHVVAMSPGWEAAGCTVASKQHACVASWQPSTSSLHVGCSGFLVACMDMDPLVQRPRATAVQRPCKGRAKHFVDHSATTTQPPTLVSYR
jgi:hypothetical protein